MRTFFIRKVLKNRGLPRLLHRGTFLGQMDQRIADIIGFIDKNLDRHISPKEAARMACLSYSQFAALFREETGKRFGEFLREKRMARAQSLLRNPGSEIKEVCFLTGYRSI